MLEVERVPRNSALILSRLAERAPGRITRYAETLGRCSAASCDGTTSRVVNTESPNTAFPTFGGIEGGFEVYMSEGYAHVDVVSAEDDETNNVIGPLFDFVSRNLE